MILYGDNLLSNFYQRVSTADSGIIKTVIK